MTTNATTGATTNATTGATTSATTGATTSATTGATTSATTGATKAATTDATTSATLPAGATDGSGTNGADAQLGPLVPVATAVDLPLPGLEADNWLAFLALLGLLRSLEEAEPTWQARVSWAGPPWEAQLHLARPATRDQVAEACARGCTSVASRFDVDGRKDVRFSRLEYREYARRVGADPVGAALAAAMAAEHPLARGGDVQPSPLVLMSGAGNQHFLKRLVEVPRGDLPLPLRKRKRRPDLASPRKLAEALFEPWRRADDADGFRWDPEEDQRYALRFDDPSPAGAAPTVHGANRLAALGFLSFACAPAHRRARIPGVVRDDDGIGFVWPLWSTPLGRSAVEAFLSHPAVLRGDLDRVRALGIVEILRARRIMKDRHANVTRARPYRGTVDLRAGRATRVRSR